MGEGIKNYGIYKKDFLILPWEGSERICQDERVKEIPDFKHTEA